MRLDAAVEHELLAARAKNTTAAKALLASFLKDAKVEEDGTVKGLADQVSRLRTGADTAFLFEAQTAPRISGLFRQARRLVPIRAPWTMPPVLRMQERVETTHRPWQF